jgi:hypothetical protein
MAIPYSKWTELSLGTRTKIAETLGIPKVRSTHVSDNRVVDDGYNIKDIENVLSVSSLQTYFNSTETDVFKLYQMLVDKMEGRYVEPVVITPDVVEVYHDGTVSNIPVEMVETKPKKKPTKKKK